ncbi:hypothetical protein ANN_10378 [Periplaneta americana]|uniref:Reverse transcriptase domain-containing protein n=1 Tax=Periplaneta americana TaxID=6978 RepID=A0ABQ8TP43_PERAM|nr:hypothetical protein ANN_10378 [Periplaneta americana]
MIHQILLGCSHPPACEDLDVESLLLKSVTQHFPNCGLGKFSSRLSLRVDAFGLMAMLSLILCVRSGQTTGHPLRCSSPTDPPYSIRLLYLKIEDCVDDDNVDGEDNDDYDNNIDDDVNDNDDDDNKDGNSDYGTENQNVTMMIMRMKTTKTRTTMRRNRTRMAMTKRMTMKNKMNVRTIAMMLSIMITMIMMNDEEGNNNGDGDKDDDAENNSGYEDRNNDNNGAEYKNNDDKDDKNGDGDKNNDDEDNNNGDGDKDDDAEDNNGYEDRNNDNNGAEYKNNDDKDGNNGDGDKNNGDEDDKNGDEDKNNNDEDDNFTHSSLGEFTVYEKGEWPEEFKETVLLLVPKKNNANKCNEFITISLISHSVKFLLRILNRRLYSKREEQLEEEQFGFKKGKGTRDAIGLLRTIGERYLEKNKEVYVVFVDLEKAFDRVDWNKLTGS